MEGNEGDEKILKSKFYFHLPDYLSLSEKKLNFSIFKKFTSNIEDLKISGIENTKIENIILCFCLLYFYRINGYNPFLINFLDTTTKICLFDDVILSFFDILLFAVDENLSEIDFSAFYNIVQEKVFKKNLYERKYNNEDKDLKMIEYFIVVYEDKKKFETLIDSLLKIEKERKKFILGIRKDGIFFCGNREIIEEEDGKTEYCVNKVFQHIQVMINSIIATKRSSEAGKFVSIPEINILSNEEYEFQFNQLVMNNRNEELVERSYTTVGLELEKVTKKYHDRIALEMNGEIMTYGEFNKKVNQASHYLRDVIGLKRGDFVCHVIEKSFECVIYFYAIGRIGCVFLAQDHTYPKEKKLFMLRETKCRAVLLNSKFTQYYRQFLETGVISHMIEIESIPIQSQPTQNIIMEPKTQPEDLLYIFFSSGTTGAPKGVQGEHRHNFTYMFSSLHYLLGKNKNLLKDYLLFHKPVFVTFLLDMFLPILSGGTMRIIPQKIRYEPIELMRYLRERKIAFIDVPPSVLRFLPRDRTSLPDLTHVTYGGEALDESTRSYWMDECGVMLGNSYGMSENIGTHLHFLEPGQGPNYLGLTMTNFYSYVLDEYLQPVPLGQPGELFIGVFSKSKNKDDIRGTSRGYLNNEVLTREKFIEDKYNPHLNSLLIRTGDLVRMYRNGHTIYMGRKCHDVRINGYRIQLDRIESVLKSHETVKDAVIIPQKTNSVVILLSFLVLSSSPPSSHQKEEIKEILMNHLKKNNIVELAIPKEYIIIKKYPLNFAGKISWNKMLLHYKELQKKKKKEEEIRKNKKDIDLIHNLDLMIRKHVSETIKKANNNKNIKNKKSKIKELSRMKSKFLKNFRKKVKMKKKKSSFLSLEDEFQKFNLSVQLLFFEKEEVEGEEEEN